MNENKSPEADACELPDIEGLERSVIQRDEDGARHCHHQTLDAPVWIPAPSADHVKDDDAVLGIAIGPGAYALPWWIMKNHHVANLELHGIPLMMVLCEACAGGGAFDRRVDGRLLHFRVDGKFNGTHILLDDETGSHWIPFSGVAVTGPLKGRRLEKLPMHQCRWHEWKRLYPDSVVPDGEGESRSGHGSLFPHPGVRRNVAFAEKSVLHKDDRLPKSELVFGVEVGEEARAYPFRALRRAGPVLNDSLGGSDIVIISMAHTWFAMAFERELDGRMLNLTRVQRSRYWRDQETRSLWDASGLACEGPLQGRRLTYVPCGIEKWMVWSSAHYGAEIFKLAGSGQARSTRGNAD